MCEWGDTILIRINGTNRGIDRCIAPIIKALNKSGFITVASCCGHGKQPGNIVLKDGQELFICPNYETARRVCSAFPPINTQEE